MKFLAEVLQGATPNIDKFVAELSDRLPGLKEYKSTPQDPEWHAEGDVHIHVVSLDNLRQQLTNRSDQSQNSKIVQLAKEQLKTLLRSQSKIVWDATNIRRDFRISVINLSRNYGALVTLVIFHCREDVYF